MEENVLNVSAGCSLSQLHRLKNKADKGLLTVREEIVVRIAELDLIM